MVTVVAAAVLVVGAAVFFGIRLLVSDSATRGPECRVPGPNGTTLDLDAVQFQHASTINAVGLRRGLSERARTIALATAWQESSLRNLDHGDRDSVGLFQQRPSQGWGTVAQIIDPVYAAGKFYDALVQVPGWETLPLAEAAQAVQYSGFPDAYAKWEDESTTLARDLGGTVPPEGSCRAGAQPVTAEQPDRAAVSGAGAATPGLAAVLGAMQAELGALPVMSVLPGGRTAVFEPTITKLSPVQAARAAAAWSVAHATTMGVTAVSIADRTWSDHAWRDGAGGTTAGQVSVTVG